MHNTSRFFQVSQSLAVLKLTSKSYAVKFMTVTLTSVLLLTACGGQSGDASKVTIQDSGIVVSADIQEHIASYAQQYTNNMMRIKERELTAQKSNPESISKIDDSQNSESKQLTAKEQLALDMNNEYLAAMNAIFTKETLTKVQINTLINVATILPDALENEKILTRLKVSNPPLSRLINQHRVWQEIEATQRLEVQKLQQQRIEDNENREQELDKIAIEFKNKIAEYDKKITKYEKKLKALQ